MDASSTAFSKRQATAMGPIPPGTGVKTEATAAHAGSASPLISLFDSLVAASMTHYVLFEHIRFYVVEISFVTFYAFFEPLHLEYFRLLFAHMQHLPIHSGDFFLQYY